MIVANVLLTVLIFAVFLRMKIVLKISGTYIYRAFSAVLPYQSFLLKFNKILNLSRFLRSFTFLYFSRIQYLCGFQRFSLFPEIPVSFLLVTLLVTLFCHCHPHGYPLGGAGPCPVKLPCAVVAIGLGFQHLREEGSQPSRIS